MKCRYFNQLFLFLLSSNQLRETERERERNELSQVYKITSKQEENKRRQLWYWSILIKNFIKNCKKKILLLIKIFFTFIECNFNDREKKKAYIFINKRIFFLIIKLYHFSSSSSLIYSKKEKQKRGETTKKRRGEGYLFDIF